LIGDLKDKGPKCRLGTCPVCGGVVTEKWSKEPNQPIKYGAQNNWHWKSSGLHCQTCGIAFFKLPQVETPEKDVK
jgi:hypothetical protein